MPAATTYTTRARTFSPSAMSSPWNGGVKNQLASTKPPTTAATGRQRTADEGDDHRQHEVQQQHARQPERVAEVGERHRDQRQPDGDEQPAPQLAARRQRREDRADAGQPPCAGAVGVRRRPGDDVDVDRARTAARRG